MKPDEELLLQKMKERGRSRTPSNEEIIQSIGMPIKRARYLLRDKWVGKNWWEYGVSWRTGWITPKGLSEEKQLKGLTNQ